MNARSLSGINDVTSNGDVALTMNARSMSGINDALGGGGDVFLAGGTAVAPQTFTGFNQFDELTKFKTTRPQLVATDTTTNPTANEFITKADGVDLFGSVTGNAQLDGGVSIEEPQTFTGFNEFENTTNFKQTIRVNEGDGANDDPEILMTAPAGYANLIQQNSTRLSGLGSSNRILQVANQTNEITQLSTGNFINKIIQIGANSSIETDGTIEANGDITTLGNITCDNKLFGDGATLEMLTNTSITDSTGWLTLREANAQIGGKEIRFYTSSTATRLGFQRMVLTQNGRAGIMVTNPSDTLQVGGRCRATSFTTSSDDRLKENQKLIINATETLSKLTPQTYDKYDNMDLSGSFDIESGLIAQEVYYNAPELRHIIHLGKNTDASGNESTPTPDDMDLSGVDIGSDHDYGSHGWSKEDNSTLNYQGLIPYLIKSNQELHERISILEVKINNM
jgi:hypothetical protein